MCFNFLKLQSHIKGLSHKGQDVGYPKSSLLLMNQCDYCDHNSCMSYCINLECTICEIIACKECIDKDAVKSNICGYLKNN
jgi:hypothetical protein